MTASRVQPTGVERYFDDDEIIVSKTDLTGKITYANDVFLRIADYTEAEVIGKPHCMIRHPDMPRAVFALLWDRIQAGHEIFAYVVNMGKNGDHYWVLAHVTPTLDSAGRVIGYHSNRRVPDRAALGPIQTLYQRLRSREREVGDRRAAIEASKSLLDAELRKSARSYDAFVWGTVANVG